MAGRKLSQAQQDAKDLQDVLWVVPISRCPSCKRMGIRPGMLCVFCHYDTSTGRCVPL